MDTETERSPFDFAEQERGTCARCGCTVRPEDAILRVEQLGESSEEHLRRRYLCPGCFVREKKASGNGVLLQTVVWGVLVTVIAADLTISWLEASPFDGFNARVLKVIGEMLFLLLNVLFGLFFAFKGKVSWRRREPDTFDEPIAPGSESCHR